MNAEKLALQAPVKMLFPLALFIFPCTFLVLGFPVVVQLFGLQP
jgi:tight adherence protein C